MIVPTEGKAWIQSNNYPTCLEGKGHLAAEVISNKGILEQNTPPKKRRWKVGGKKKTHKKKRSEHYGWKGHNGFGTYLQARFGVCASCQYWQLLKTFKEVKTLFSVYKSSVL